MDAGAFGCRLCPADAYRFAKGQEITASSGQRARLSRSLDFLVVADHSDNMGFFPDLLAGKPELLADPTGRRWYDMVQSGKGAEAALEIISAFSQDKFPKALMYLPGTPPYRSAWRETIKAAEEANDPGRFTAFIGYEWTSNTGGNNLHRNVIFRDGGDLANKVEPMTVYPPGSDNPRDLWKWMAAFEDKTGGDVLAIAHNGNLSNGTMFPMVESFTGKPIDRAYAEQRAKWERLYEASQIKGDGETHPFLSPNDEFANFERWDKGNLDLSVLKKPEMLQFEYARRALQNGLKLEKELGVNPYKFGMVGSTDAHSGLTAVEEENFFGKTSSSEPSPVRATHPFAKTEKATIMGWEQTSSGYAAVWAKSNTREDLFDAMERRETYATTGPRMVVRFFGGWDYEAKDAQEPQPGGDGLPQGRADGRRPAGGDRRQGADLSRGGAQGPHRRKPGSLPDREGLAGCEGRGPREGLRRRLVGRPQARRRREGARRSGTPWTCRTPPTRTRSEPPSSSPCGRTRTSTRRSGPSTMDASSRSRRRAGRPTTPSTSASRCRRKSP